MVWMTRYLPKAQGGEEPTSPRQSETGMPQILKDLIYSISATNMVDIGILACLVYFVLSWFQGTRAFSILATLLGIGLFYVVASRFGLILTSLLFQYLWAAIIVVLVIVFQPEIREMLDRASPIRYLSGRQPSEVEPDIIDEIVTAVAELARLRLGALIVFQRLDRLDNLILKGKRLDCEVSADALAMIFQKTSPLHDGAVIVRRDRIKEAGCILPLSRDEDLSSHYGTRHRAALGLAERTDALCVVVSEERGEVSLVVGKEIASYKKKMEFRQALQGALVLGQGSRPVRASRRVLDVLRSNFPLKVMSLVASVFLWFVVVGPQRSEVGMSVPIQYTDLPPGMEITGKWMDRIDVRIRGSESGLANIKQGSVRAVVDLSEVVPGLNFFRITEKNLLVPPGIKISQIRPSDLHLNVEAASIKKFSVMPLLVGAVPEKVKIVIVPQEIRIRAIKEELKKITSVTTDPIRVADLVAKGKMSVPVVIKPERLKIDNVDPMNVTVSLEPDTK